MKSTITVSPGFAVEPTRSLAIAETMRQSRDVCRPGNVIAIHSANEPIHAWAATNFETCA